MEKCSVCSSKIETAIFKNTGVCSEICAKVKRKEITSKQAKKMRIDLIVRS